MQPDRAQALLFPYVSSPKRIFEELVLTFQSIESVKRLAIAGSLAEGNHDGYDEIQLVMEATDPLLVVNALNDIFPIRYFRPFSGMDFPSGRFWLHDESPFNFVAMAFYKGVELEEAIAKGKLAHGAVIREIPSDTKDDWSPPRQYKFPDISNDGELSRLVEPTLFSIRSVVREGEDLGGVMANLTALQQGRVRGRVSDGLIFLIDEISAMVSELVRLRK